MTEAEIKTIICNLFLGGEDAGLEPDSNLLEDGICDSLGLVQIVAEVEKRVPGIKIRDVEVTHDSFGSIQRIAAFVAKKRAAI
jgi:acyl carrier protein